MNWHTFMAQSAFSSPYTPSVVQEQMNALSPVVAFPLHNTGLAVLCCGGAEGVKSLVGLTQFPSLVSTAKASNDASFLQ